MRKNILLITTMLIVSMSNSCFAFDDGDFQYWNTESISWKINEDWKMKVEEEFRFGNDVSNFYYQHSDLGLAYYGIAEWLDIGVNYRLVFAEKDDDWSYENRPHINTILKFDFNDFNFSTRNRFEYRDKENKGSGWRYKNKFTVKLPKFTQSEIQPYVADEIFVDFDEEGLNRNRLYGGIELKVFDNLKGDIFYLWQSSEADDEWTDYHILGTKLKLSF